MPEPNLDLGLLIVAASLGLLGSYAANYLWWWAVDKKVNPKILHFLGWFALIGFILMFLRAYFIYKGV